MKDAVTKRFAQAGALISEDGSRMEMPLPSNIGKEDGKLTTVFLDDSCLFILIQIRSTKITERIEESTRGLRKLKINYCSGGRCELRLKSGERTFLTAGEIAVDTGQAESSFFYPNGEYTGFEVIFHVEEALRGQECEKAVSLPSAATFLYHHLEEQTKPWIRTAGKFLSDFYDVFQYYAEAHFGNNLLYIKCTELLTYLAHLDFGQVQVKRTYYSESQVEIAKRAKELICSDLSRRHTARELAERFGVSETSLKNYFRSVYGCGYAEFQQSARMEKAAEMLRSTENKLADIGLKVGFSTQAKFSAAFKACFGVTLLEYRRKCKLQRASDALDG